MTNEKYEICTAHGLEGCECDKKLPMTETHSLGDWEKEFDLLEKLDHGDVQFHCSGCKKTVKDFIRETFLAQKEGFRREIEGMKSESDSLVKDVRNDTCNEMLTKLDTNHFKSAFGDWGGAG